MTTSDLEPRIAALFDALASLGIATDTVRHPPVLTVDEAKRHRVRHHGTHVKNLFLRNKKGAMWLVVLHEDRVVDLRELGRRIGAGHVSFGSAERLREHLGVEPGSVTPLAAWCDRRGAVRVVLDRVIFASDPVHCHPLSCDRTTSLSASDLVRFLRHTGHEPELLDLDAPTDPALAERGARA